MFAVLAGPGGAQEVSGGDRFGLGFNVTADSRCSLWFTGDDDNDDPLKGNVIDYDTNPIFTWTVTASLTWRQHRLIGVSVQRPFETPPDRDVLAKVLTPEQAQKWEKTFARIQRFWLPPLPGESRGPLRGNTNQ